MPYLVDGDNLLGTWPGRSRTDDERRGLAFELERFARAEGKEVAVVFDGPTPAHDPGGPVRFAGPGRRADDVILALLRRQPDPRGWTVVTSDRSLGDRCRNLEARVERCDRFRRRLNIAPGEEKPAREADIAYWMKIFGEDG